MGDEAAVAGGLGVFGVDMDRMAGMEQIGVARDELGAAVEGRQIEAHAGADIVEPEGVGGAHRSLLMETTPRRGEGRRGAVPPVAPKRGRARQRFDRTVDR